MGKKMKEPVALSISPYQRVERLAEAGGSVSGIDTHELPVPTAVLQGIGAGPVVIDGVASGGTTCIDSAMESGCGSDCVEVQDVSAIGIVGCEASTPVSLECEMFQLDGEGGFADHGVELGIQFGEDNQDGVFPGTGARPSSSGGVRLRTVAEGSVGGVGSGGPTYADGLTLNPTR